MSLSSYWMQRVIVDRLRRRDLRVKLPSVTLRSFKDIKPGAFIKVLDEAQVFVNPPYRHWKR